MFEPCTLKLIECLLTAVQSLVLAGAKSYWCPLSSRADVRSLPVAGDGCKTRVLKVIRKVTG